MYELRKRITRKWYIFKVTHYDIIYQDRVVGGFIGELSNFNLNMVKESLELAHRAGRLEGVKDTLKDFNLRSLGLGRR